jgi:thiol-disulfide isomerase/thioredoxin
MRALVWVLALMSCSGTGNNTAVAPLAWHPSTAAPTIQTGGSSWRVDATELARVVASSSSNPRVYNVWATWCGPCAQEMPQLKQFGEANPQIELWFINVDHAGLSDNRVQRAVDKFEIGAFHHIRPVRGENDLTSKLNLPDVVPVTVAVNTSGTRKRTIMGRVNPSDLIDMVNQLR